MPKNGRTSFLTRSKSYQVRSFRMIRIPEGPFTMGLSDEQVLFLLRSEDWAEEWQEWYDNDLFMVEQPQHIVYVPEFYIAQYPVTNADYFAFVWQTGYRMPRTWNGFYYPDGTDDHPVTGVSRHDVLAYIEWLNQQTGLKYRLPTEAEWEKAARGDMDARIYPWGDELGSGGATPKREASFHHPGGELLTLRRQPLRCCRYGWKCMGVDQQPLPPLSVLGYRWTRSS